MPKQLLTETIDHKPPAVLEHSGRWRVRVIDAGVGSSGYYPATTLEAAVRDRVFPAGTHVYLDHPGQTEQGDRPERSLRDLVGVLESDAYWDPSTQAIEAVVKVYSAYRPLLHEMAGDIGMSIRAYGLSEAGEVDGVRMPVVTQLLGAESVDFVTKPGRGGRVLEVLESARTQHEQPVAEASTEDMRDRLSRALDDAYPPNEYGDRQAWLCDFDSDRLVVWYRRDGRTWEQSYMTNGSAAQLIGEPVEVRTYATYEPVSQATQANEATHAITITTPGQIDPAQVREAISAMERAKHREPPEAEASAPAEPTQKESLVDTVTIPAAELSQLRESVAIADRAAAELAEARTKLAECEAALAEARKTTAASMVAKAVAESTLPEAARGRISAQFAEAAEVTADQVQAAIEAEQAYIDAIASTVAPKPLGFGVTESHRTHTRSPWGTEIKEA